MRLPKLAAATLLGLAGLVSLVACGSSSVGEESGETNSALAGSSDNDHTAFTFFVSKGFTAIQAAAIVGNLDQESSMDPTIAQKGGPGRGIAQWSVGGRWTQENAFAKQEGGSANDLQVQLDFIWQELSTNAAFGLASLQAATDLNSAVEIFQDKYEICGKCNAGSRVTFAQRALSAFGSEAANVQPSGDDDDSTQNPTTTTPTSATNNNNSVFTNTGDDDDSTNTSQGGDNTDDGPCTANGVPGECISTSNCSAQGGQSTAGLCPGAANIQCCTMSQMAGDDDDDDYYGYAH